MTEQSWNIIPSGRTKYALGIKHPNGSVNHVSATVEKKSDNMWYWVVSARIISAPFNTGMEETNVAAMNTAEKAIKEYETEGKIMPCPFCGSENIHHENNQADANWIRCQDCSATGGLVLANATDEIAKRIALIRWNRRV